MKQLTNHHAERVHTWRLGITLVCGEHRFKCVRGHQNNFGKLRAVGLTCLLGQNVFEFMRYFAQLGETARRGISLKRMHHPSHASNDFFIRWTSLEFEPGLIQRLEEFVRTLKKKRAKLRAAILGRKAQLFTSRR